MNKYWIESSRVLLQPRTNWKWKISDNKKEWWQQIPSSVEEDKKRITKASRQLSIFLFHFRCEFFLHFIKGKRKKKNEGHLRRRRDEKKNWMVGVWVRPIKISITTNNTQFRFLFFDHVPAWKEFLHFFLCRFSRENFHLKKISELFPTKKENVQVYNGT